MVKEKRPGGVGLRSGNEISLILGLGDGRK